MSVFIKLENLINEFAAVEQVTSNIALNNTKICRIDDVIDEALDIAMVDPGQVTISKLEDVSLNADFKLLSIAAKN